MIRVTFQLSKDQKVELSDAWDAHFTEQQRGQEGQLTQYLSCQGKFILYIFSMTVWAQKISRISRGRDFLTRRDSGRLLPVSHPNGF